jgi:hypothetical protein
MEQLMWVGIWIVAGICLLILIPVLVIGGWFIVVTLIMGLFDKTIGLLDQGWKTIRRKIRTRETPVLRVSQQNAIESKELAAVSGSPGESP